MIVNMTTFPSEDKMDKNIHSVNYCRILKFIIG